MRVRADSCSHSASPTHVLWLCKHYSSVAVNAAQVRAASAFSSAVASGAMRRQGVCARNSCQLKQRCHRQRTPCARVAALSVARSSRRLCARLRLLPWPWCPGGCPPPPPMCTCRGVPARSERAGARREQARTESDCTVRRRPREHGLFDRAESSAETSRPSARSTPCKRRCPPQSLQCWWAFQTGDSTPFQTGGSGLYPSGFGGSFTFCPSPYVERRQPPAAHMLTSVHTRASGCGGACRANVAAHACALTMSPNANDDAGAYLLAGKSHPPGQGGSGQP